MARRKCIDVQRDCPLWKSTNFFLKKVDMDTDVNRNIYLPFENWQRYSSLRGHADVFKHSTHLPCIQTSQKYRLGRFQAAASQILWRISQPVSLSRNVGASIRSHVSIRHRSCRGEKRSSIDLNFRIPHRVPSPALSKNFRASAACPNAVRSRKWRCLSSGNGLHVLTWEWTAVWRLSAIEPLPTGLHCTCSRSIDIVAKHNETEAMIDA